MDRLHLRALALGGLLSAACFPGTRMGAAEVKLTDDRLCLGVTDDEIDRLGDLKLYGVTVYDRSTAPPPEVWSVRVNDPTGTPGVLLTAGRCIPYGVAPPGYTASPTPAPRLAPDRLYSLDVSASPARGKRDGTMGYDVMFCLRSTGPRRLVTLPPNATSCAGP